MIDKKIDISEWVAERDNVINTLDTNKFKAFIEKYKGSMYDENLVLPSDYILKASMCKMALNITKGINEDTKTKAYKWLNENNISTSV